MTADPEGCGTAFLGKPDVSFPLEAPIGGTEVSTCFRSMDCGRDVRDLGACVGISKPAASDAGGFGSQLGRVAVAAALDPDGLGGCRVAGDPVDSPRRDSDTAAFVEPSLRFLGSVAFSSAFRFCFPCDGGVSATVAELVTVGELAAPAVGAFPPTSPVSSAQASPAMRTAAVKTATIQYFVFNAFPPSITAGTPDDTPT